MGTFLVSPRLYGRRRFSGVSFVAAGLRTMSPFHPSPFSRYRARVGPQDAEQGGALLERLERPGDMRIVGMALDVEEKYVIPFLATGWPRLDARHADLVSRQRLEQPEQRGG